VAKSPVTRVREAARRARPGLDHPQGLVQVGDLDLGVAADHLLALHERPVGDDRFTALQPHRGRRLRCLQLAAAPELAGMVGEPLVGLLVGPFALGRAHGL
jgi:hypothetical protein